jgi:hypothetical protein
VGAILQLNRPTGHLGGSARRYWLVCDGRRFGAVRPGETLKLEVPLGWHRFHLEFDAIFSMRSNTLDIDVLEAEELRLTCRPRWSIPEGLREIVRGRYRTSEALLLELV